MTATLVVLDVNHYKSTGRTGCHQLRVYLVVRYVVHVSRLCTNVTPDAAHCDLCYMVHNTRQHLALYYQVQL